MASEKTITRTLEDRGWRRQFVAAEPRLSEAVEMYGEAGFEVHLEPLPPQEKQPGKKGCETNGECRTCFGGFEDQYKIIFTKPNVSNRDQLEDDLF
ncbi:MAG: hypothetical protein JRD04_04910 [Deltaproteobacteria bacterium]|nr:hypothetical protein [Deltaproteobacteria bacterium]